MNGIYFYLVKATNAKKPAINECKNVNINDKCKYVVITTTQIYALNQIVLVQLFHIILDITVQYVLTGFNI
jgi:hypothetical protein